MYASYTFDKHYQDFIDIVEWAMAKMAKPLPKRPQPKKPNRKPRKTR